MIFCTKIFGKPGSDISTFYSGSRSRWQKLLGILPPFVQEPVCLDHESRYLHYGRFLQNLFVKSHLVFEIYDETRSGILQVHKLRLSVDDLIPGGETSGKGKKGSKRKRSPSPPPQKHAKRKRYVGINLLLNLLKTSEQSSHAILYIYKKALLQSLLIL